MPPIQKLAKIKHDFDKLRIEAGLKKRRVEKRRRPTTKALSTGRQTPPEIVEIIANLRREGVTVREISRRLGVARGSILGVIAEHKLGCGLEQMKLSLSAHALSLARDLLNQLDDDLKDMPAKAIPAAVKLLADLHLVTIGSATEIKEVRHVVNFADHNADLQQLRQMARTATSNTDMLDVAGVPVIAA